MKLLSGNEAIAQGAWEAGCHIGTAYPGTPSTETMEAFAALPDVYAEWCPNEKVALEVAVGASAAGARTLVTMKHVGVNVCADPLFTCAYTGVNGGLVVLAADDPGMFSSQNEQDSRYYAMAAQVPMFEPSDSSEARLFTKDAYDLSEQFDLPFMIRSTVRISHTKTPVDVGQRRQIDPIPYEKDPGKWVMMPAFSKPRRKNMLERLEKLHTWVETCSYNVIERCNTESNASKIGVICAGAVYQHVKEALPDVDVFKLGITWPLPAHALRTFAQSVDEIYVAEEASTYLSDAVRSCGIDLDTFKVPLPKDGELRPVHLLRALGRPVPHHCESQRDIPNRPPALCPGCPHRLVFKELSRMHAIVTGDIGCYTLGALPPLSAMDTTLCMGASVSMSHGFELAMKHRDHKPIVAVIGDSTFAHSGVTSLMNTIYNKGAGTICILDNRTTAMTGQQGNPFNGVTLQHRKSHELDLPGLVRALGVDNVQVVDAFDMKKARDALKKATARDELDVIIFEGPCALLKKEHRPASMEQKPNSCAPQAKKKFDILDAYFDSLSEDKPLINIGKPFEVTYDCTGCGICKTLGCPAISSDPDTGLSSIDQSLCTGCGQCAQYCNFGAIQPRGGMRL